MKIINLLILLILTSILSAQETYSTMSVNQTGKYQSANQSIESYTSSLSTDQKMTLLEKKYFLIETNLEDKENESTELYSLVSDKVRHLPGELSEIFDPEKKEQWLLWIKEFDEEYNFLLNEIIRLSAKTEKSSINNSKRQ